MQQQAESEMVQTYTLPLAKPINPEGTVPTYTLPSDISFEDIRGAFSGYHDLIEGDNPRYLIDDKYGVRLVFRGDRYLDLLFYNPFTLEEYPLAIFETYQGNDSECEDWALLEFSLCWLALIEKTKNLRALDGNSSHTYPRSVGYLVENPKSKI